MNDRNHWNSICGAVVILLEPRTLKRVTSHPNSVDYDEPQLLRVTLSSPADKETVLLSFIRLHNSSLEMRLLPSILWNDRPKANSNCEDICTSDQKRAIFALLGS